MSAPGSLDDLHRIRLQDLTEGSGSTSHSTSSVNSARITKQNTPPYADDAEEDNAPGAGRRGPEMGEKETIRSLVPSRWDLPQNGARRPLSPISDRETEKCSLLSSTRHSRINSTSHFRYVTLSSALITCSELTPQEAEEETNHSIGKPCRNWVRKV